MQAILLKFRTYLAGRRLAKSIERHQQAADRLDALVREVLKP